MTATHECDYCSNDHVFLCCGDGAEQPCAGSATGRPVQWCEGCAADHAVKCYSCDRLLCGGCRIETGDNLSVSMPKLAACAIDQIPQYAMAQVPLPLKEYACHACHNVCCVCGEPKPDCETIPSEGRVCGKCRAGMRNEVAEEMAKNPGAYALDQREILKWVGVADAK